jgi:hypothetical protein
MCFLIACSIICNSHLQHMTVNVQLLWDKLLWDKLKTFIICRGVARPLFEWGGGGVSSFCQVINPNFAESLQSLINISFPKIVGERGGDGRSPIFFRTYKKFSEHILIFRTIS